MISNLSKNTLKKWWMSNHSQYLIKSFHWLIRYYSIRNIRIILYDYVFHSLSSMKFFIFVIIIVIIKSINEYIYQYLSDIISLIYQNEWDYISMIALFVRYLNHYMIKLQIFSIPSKQSIYIIQSSWISLLIYLIIVASMFYWHWWISSVKSFISYHANR